MPQALWLTCLAVISGASFLVTLVVFNGYDWQPIAIGAAAHFSVNLFLKVSKLIGGGAVGYAVIAALVAVAFAMTATDLTDAAFSCLAIVTAHFASFLPRLATGPVAPYLRAALHSPAVRVRRVLGASRGDRSEREPARACDACWSWLESDVEWLGLFHNGVIASLDRSLQACPPPSAFRRVLLRTASHYFLLTKVGRRSLRRVAEALTRCCFGFGRPDAHLSEADLLLPLPLLSAARPSTLPCTRSSTAGCPSTSWTCSSKSSSRQIRPSQTPSRTRRWSSVAAAANGRTHPRRETRR